MIAKLGVLLVFAMASAAAQELSGSNMACVRSMSAPTYPPIARQARVQGIVTVRIVVSKSGDVEKQTVDGPRILQQALGEWQFDPGCEGKTVTLRLEFLLDGGRSGSGDATYRWIAPNMFLISGPTPFINF
ncbi:MAG: energy transducer TonB [Bryobacteraceae bacterium]